MPVILKQTPVGKRAEFILQPDLDKMLDAGTAMQCAGYEVYEEVTDGELKQGYMTRNMEALPKPRRGRPPKPVQADPVTVPVFTDTPAAK
jgi:hypothetical protein